MLYKAKKYLSLVCKLHCSRFCSFVQCIKLICKLTSINWSNFCKLNIWGNIAAVENCQIALKGVCLWNYLVYDWLLFDKHPMKAQLRRNKGTTRALCMHDHWNSGSKHVHQLLMPDYCASMMHNDKIWPILLELWWPTSHT